MELRVRATPVLALAVLAGGLGNEGLRNGLIDGGEVREHSHNAQQHQLGWLLLAVGAKAASHGTGRLSEAVELMARFPFLRARARRGVRHQQEST